MEGAPQELGDPVSLASHTGNVRAEQCEGCGHVVLQREIVVVSGPGRGVRHWEHEKHNAPCGLPCAFGGVGRDALKNNLFHGSERFSCPACGAKKEKTDDEVEGSR